MKKDAQANAAISILDNFQIVALDLDLSQNQDQDLGAPCRCPLSKCDLAVY